jgi:hypothetical protein
MSSCLSFDWQNNNGPGISAGAFELRSKIKTYERPGDQANSSAAADPAEKSSLGFLYCSPNFGGVVVGSYGKSLSF